MTDRASPGRKRLWVAFAVVNLFLAMLLVVLAEGVIELVLEHPPRIKLVIDLLSSYYTDYERRIVQFLPECARYDDELGYLLAPGECRFANRGFDTQLQVNSAGLRDDEESLSGPQAIVVGDSHTMGWGVEADEAFPSLIENDCSVPVLNAGISSYGTAREMRLLSKLDRSALKWLIVQYDSNDARENREFRQRGNRLVPMPHGDYKAIVEEQSRRQSYVPGQHTFRLSQLLGRLLVTRISPSTASESPDGSGEAARSEVGDFLNALLAGPALASDVRVIVFEVTGRGRRSDGFTKELRSTLAQGDLPEPWRSMQVLEPNDHTQFDHHLRIDGHLAASGHRTLSNRILAAMGCRSWGGGGRAPDEPTAGTSRSPAARRR